MTRIHRAPLLLTMLASLLSAGITTGQKPLQQTSTPTTTHRVVVDEETRDGKPVDRGSEKEKAVEGGFKDLDLFDRRAR